MLGANAKNAMNSYKCHEQPQLTTNLPLISVIIPAYNAEKFIERTLQSVLAQTYRNIEVIVVNDGSVDQTAATVRSIIQQDQRVILLQQPNSGVAAARNLAIENSTGELIAPIDADDIWYPENLEKQVQCLLEADSSVGLIYSWSVDIDENDLLIGAFRAAKIEGDVYLTLLCHNFLGNASASMFRRECLDQVGNYDREMKKQNGQGCEDWDLYLRIAEKYQFRVVTKFLVGYRKPSESMSRDYTTMARSHKLMLQTVQQKYPAISAYVYRLSKSNFYMYFAHQSSRAGNHKKTFFWLFQALKADPISPLLRIGLYRLSFKSLLHLITRSRMLHLILVKLSIPFKSKSSYKNQVNSVSDIEQQTLKITLMLWVEDIFHRLIIVIFDHTKPKKI